MGGLLGGMAANFYLLTVEPSVNPGKKFSKSLYR
jgi:hypothetical protein